LNLLGIFKTFLGIDTAVFITLLAGYRKGCEGLLAFGC
jgi:hypothetical protein